MLLAGVVEANVDGKEAEKDLEEMRLSISSNSTAPLPPSPSRSWEECPESRFSRMNPIRERFDPGPGGL